MSKSLISAFEIEKDGYVSINTGNGSGVCE